MNPLDPRVLDEYANAFANFGVLGDEPANVASRMRSSPIKEQLVGALDDWARVAFILDNEGLPEKVLAVARQLAPDPAWGDRLRQVEVWRDQEAFGKLVAEAPAGGLSPQLLTLIGTSNINRGQRELWLRKAQAEHPTDYWLNLCLGELLDNTSPMEAIGFYRAAIAIRPGDGTAYNQLGSALNRQNRQPEAIAAYRKAIENDPQHSWAWHNLAGCLQAQNKLDEAISAYRKALEIDPDFAGAHLGLGNALSKQNNLDEALACYRKAIEFSPNFEQAQYGAGNVLLKQQKLDEAVACYCKAIKINPNYADAYYGIGCALLEQKKVDEAIASFKEAAFLDPDSAALAVLVQRLREEGSLEDTIAEFRRKADSPVGKIALARLLAEQANRLAGKERYDEAIALIRDADRLQPHSSKTWSILKSLYAQRGMWTDLANQLSRELDINPQDVALRNSLALVHLRDGRLDDYRTVCHEMLEPDATKSLDIVNTGGVALTALLLPVDGVDLDRAYALADVAGRAEEAKTYSSSSKALAEYRRGRFQSAKEWGADIVTKSDPKSQRCATGWLVQALACQRLEQSDLARAALAKADASAKAAFSSGYNSNWRGHITHEILRHEAAELLGISPPSSSDSPTDEDKPSIANDKTPASTPTND